MKIYTDILKLREHYGLKNNNALYDTEWIDFRFKLLVEELNEFHSAFKSHDDEEALDALIDLIVVATGTAIGLDYDLIGGWNEVHKANMQKIRTASPDDSKRGNVLDLVKPEGWQSPDMRKYVYGPSDISAYDKARLICESKSDDYQNNISRKEYFPFGLKSYVQMINMKTLRIRSVMDKSEINNESIKDSLLDLMNYCAFTIDYLEGKE